MRPELPYDGNVAEIVEENSFEAHTLGRARDPDVSGAKSEGRREAHRLCSSVPLRKDGRLKRNLRVNR